MHQAVHHLHHVKAGTEGRVDGAHFEPNDAAADDQHLLRYFFERQRPRRVNDTRIIGDEGQAHHLRARRDDGFVEANDLLLAGFLLAAVARGQFNHEVIGVEELADAANNVDLAHFCHAGQTTGQFANHFIFPCAQLVEINLRFAKGDAMRGQRAGFVCHRRDMQQRLGRDATDV